MLEIFGFCLKYVLLFENYAIALQRVTEQNLKPDRGWVGDAMLNIVCNS
jgi:hypothetical protein